MCSAVEDKAGKVLNEPQEWIYFQFYEDEQNSLSLFNVCLKHAGLNKYIHLECEIPQ